VKKKIQQPKSIANKISDKGLLNETPLKNNVKASKASAAPKKPVYKKIKAKKMM
jgi:hypothetical protein